MALLGGALAPADLEGPDDEIVPSAISYDLDAVFRRSAALVDEAVVQPLGARPAVPVLGRHLLQPVLDRPLEPLALAGDYLGTATPRPRSRPALAAAERARTALT